MMYSKTRTKQGGSVVSFLIVGIVLMAIALVAIYFVQQRGEQAAEQPQPTPTVGTSNPSTETSPVVPAPSSLTSPESSVSPRPSTSPSTVPPTGVMPSTGPTEDLLFTSLPLVLMVVAVSAYVQSRRSPLN